MTGKNFAAPLFGFLTLILCFITIACFILKAWSVFWICLILFIASLAVFSALRFQEFVDFFVSRQLRYGTNVALSIIGVIGIAIFINIIVAQRFDISLDLTALRDNSLSEQTKKIVKSLEKDVEIIAFYSNETSSSALSAMNMLELFQRESRYITYSFKNPYLDAQLANQRLRDGTIVFSTKDRQEEVTIVSEQKFTSAILKLIQDKTKKVYFTVGHGEFEIEDLSPSGLSKLKAELELQNYEPTSISFLTEPEIPSDCELLVISGPTVPFTTNEIDLISKYLEKGGKLLLLFRPSKTAKDVNQGLVQLLKKWKVSVGNDLVQDRYVYDADRGPSAPVPRFEQHEITRQLPFDLAFPNTRSVTPLENVETKFTVKSIAKTVSPLGVSWGERERKADGKFSSNGYTAGVDLPAPVSLAATVEKHATIDTNPNSNVGNTRIAVFGSSEFAINFYFGIPNRDILLTTCNWLTQEEDLIAITEPDREGQRLRRMTNQQAGVVQITAIFLIPLIVFIGGLVVWWNRREGGTP